MRTHPYAVSVQLTVAGFLSSTLIMDWLRPGMTWASHRALGALLPIVAPCLFGLVGFSLGALALCRRRWFAILLTSMLGPSLGAIGATCMTAALGQRLHAGEVATQGAVIGAVFVPFVAMTWLRMQSAGQAPAEIASHQRASWSVVLLALCLLQIFVAVAANHFRSDRTDSSTAIGVLAGCALIAVCIADRRAIRSMRADLVLRDELSGDVNPVIFERIRTNYAGNVVCCVLGWVGLAAAHGIGGPKYLLL